MTSIRGCRMHLLHLSTRRSFGSLDLFYHRWIHLNPCLLVYPSLVSVWAAKGACFAAYCSLAHSHAKCSSTIQMWRGKKEVHSCWEAERTCCTHNNSVFSKVIYCRHRSSLVLSYITTSSFANTVSQVAFSTVWETLYGYSPGSPESLWTHILREKIKLMEVCTQMLLNTLRQPNNTFWTTGWSIFMNYLKRIRSCFSTPRHIFTLNFLCSTLYLFICPTPIHGHGWMLLLFHLRIVTVTIKLQLVSWNSLIGQRGLSRLVKWEVGYTIITPNSQLHNRTTHKKMYLDGGFLLWELLCFRVPVLCGLHSLIIPPLGCSEQQAPSHWVKALRNLLPLFLQAKYLPCVP